MLVVLICRGGGTQVVAVVRGNTLVVANAGDSRCVCSRAGTAVAMTQDHKPTDAEEHARIMRVSVFRQMRQKFC